MIFTAEVMPLVNTAKVKEHISYHFINLNIALIRKTSHMMDIYDSAIHLGTSLIITQRDIQSPLLVFPYESEDLL